MYAMKYICVIAFPIIFLFENYSLSTDSNYPNNDFRISVLCDSSNNLSIDQVKSILKENPDSFLSLTDIQQPFIPVETYWLYLQRTGLNTNVEYVFTFRMWVSNIEVYPYPYFAASHGGKMVPGRLNELSGCNVYLDAGASTYLVKIQNKFYSGASAKNIQILPVHAFQKKKEQFDLLQGIIIGFFGLMLFYNLLLYLVVRKKEYLFYVIYILFNSLYMLFIFSYSEIYIFPNNYKLNLIFFTLQPIGLYFYTTFLRLMLLKHCQAYTHAMDRKTFYPYSHILLFANLIIAITIFFRMDLFIAAFQISNLINCLIGIILLCYFYKKSDDIMHIIIAGSIIMIVFGIRGILNIPTDVVVNNLYFEIGLFIELLFFTYAINKEYQHDIEKSYKAELLKHQLETELESKNQELVYQAIQLSAKEEAILSIKNKVKNLTLSKATNTSILNEIETNDSINKNLWKEFELHFNETHPNFYKVLIERYPYLTSNEIRLCAFLKLNLNTKEISIITQKSTRGIEVMRSRIRQKMDLPRDANLGQILSHL